MQNTDYTRTPRALLIKIMKKFVDKNKTILLMSLGNEEPVLVMTHECLGLKYEWS